MLNQNQLLLKNLNMAKHEQHPFHLVSPSPWPLVLSFALFAFVIHLVCWFYVSKLMCYFLSFEICFILFILSKWFGDIIKESYSEGHHTRKVRSGLYLGMVLFIVSEVMFFFSFFWAYFHCALSPSVMIGCSWPLKGIEYIGFDIPAANTLALFSSGVAVTYAHKVMSLPPSLTASARRKRLLSIGVGLLLAIFYAILFTCVQLWEYKTLTFSINDGIYGSLFFMLTGFHGFHVIIGTVFLFIMLIRVLNTQFGDHYVGLICAIWYWHFVDVVWLFLWIALYVDVYPSFDFSVDDVLTLFWTFPFWFGVRLLYQDAVIRIRAY